MGVPSRSRPNFSAKDALGQRHAAGVLFHLSRTVGFALCLAFGACHEAGSSRSVYFGTIARVEQPNGVFYSPRLGSASVALTLIYLRPSGAGGRADKTMLRIAVLGAYDPTRFGKPGDSVSFEYAGSARPGAELDYEDLLKYAVVPGKPSR